MKAIHAIRVAHRDLKPQNVLLEAAGPSCNLKISDFGVCYAGEEGTVKSLNVSNKLGVSFPYSSHEILSQFVSGKQVKGTLADFQAYDVYSFAVKLWELLHRELPWKDNLRREIAESVAKGERPPITLTSDANNPQLQFLLQLITECWDQQPFNRPPFVIVNPNSLSSSSLSEI